MPSQILLLVRQHWAVENDCFNSLDLQWHEDAAPWCTRGTATWALGLLRLMAYNTAQLMRRRKLRPKRADGTRLPPIAWLGEPSSKNASGHSNFRSLCFVPAETALPLPGQHT